MLLSGSKEVAKAAISIAMTNSREEEKLMKEEFHQLEIRAAAVDYGGEAILAMKTMVERALVAAKRELLLTLRKAPLPGRPVRQWYRS